MPVHDWTQVDAGIFHAFHLMWISRLNAALNGGLLPPGYYALPEQHAGATIPDVLTLHADPPPAPDGADDGQRSRVGGGVALADSPPRVRVRQTLRPSYLARRRTVAVRHVSGDRLVAMLEIVSPSNKDRPRSVEQFADKAAAALEHGISLLVIDLFPPGRSDPSGIYAAIRQQLALVGPGPDEASGPTAAEPLTLLSLSGGATVEAFIEQLAVGATLPEMPLFLDPDRYVAVPLETTYRTAFGEMPSIYRDRLA